MPFQKRRHNLQICASKKRNFELNFFYTNSPRSKRLSMIKIQLIDHYEVNDCMQIKNLKLEILVKGEKQR